MRQPPHKHPIAAPSPGLDQEFLGSRRHPNLLREFTPSRKIYLLNGEGPPGSNLIRAQLLKQHFLANDSPFKTQTPNPQMLFKFGNLDLSSFFLTRK